MYDLIGDIHGHAEKLILLLSQLGYQRREGVYRHFDRKVIFLGDFIDRGPQIAQVLQIVQPMVESGAALAVMGNHELNALAYHTDDHESPGQHLRRHNPHNNTQHQETLNQLSPKALAQALDWFRTLPMWLDLDGLRVIHACWDNQVMLQVQQAIKSGQPIDDHFLQRACKKGNDLFDPIEILLKGKEAELPEGMFFRDKDGQVRTSARMRWYLPAAGKTYRSYSLTDAIDCDAPVSDHVVAEAAPYPPDAKPVFVGHYALTAQQPHLLAPNVACVDYNVARGSFLCGYRWNGEQKLSNENFVTVQ